MALQGGQLHMRSEEAGETETEEKSIVCWIIDQIKDIELQYFRVN